MRNMKKIIAGVLAAVMFAGCASAKSTSTAKENQKKIEARTAVVFELLPDEGVEANVTVIRGQENIVAYEGMRLTAGDTVTTDDSAAAYLRIDDDKTLRMEKNSAVTLTEVKNKSLLITLESGELYTNVANKLDSDETMSFSAGGTTMSIRGTSLDIGFDPESNEGVKLMVTDGHVAVSRGDSAETMVNGGEKAIMAADDSAEFEPAVSEFSFDELPVAVVNEIENNAALKKRVVTAIAETRGIDASEVESNLAGVTVSASATEAPAAKKVAEKTETAKSETVKKTVKKAETTAKPETKATAAPTVKPTVEPTAEPTATPTVQPTAEPTATPTIQPTAEPTTTPTVQSTAEPTTTPTVQPTAEPTATPTVQPTAEPTATPTVQPTAESTTTPTVEPTTEPAKPTPTPSAEPTPEPAPTPTVEPTPAPTVQPTPEPTPVADPEAAKINNSGSNATATFSNGVLTISGTNIDLDKLNAALRTVNGLTEIVFTSGTTMSSGSIRGLFDGLATVRKIDMHEMYVQKASYQTFPAAGDASTQLAVLVLPTTTTDYDIPGTWYADAAYTEQLDVGNAGASYSRVHTFMSKSTVYRKVN